MKFDLVFDSTGDSIPMQTVGSDNADLLCYYVEKLKSRNCNSFLPSTDVGNIIEGTIEKLQATIDKCNNFVYELLDQKIQTYTHSEYLDQKILNKLHADWVNSQSILYDINQKRQKYKSLQAEFIHEKYPDEIRMPPVGDVLDKLGVKSLYSEINLIIHSLESIFNEIRYEVDTVEWLEFENCPPKSILTNNKCNLKFHFNHPGRTLYNKFCYFDHSLEFADENNYNQLLKFITLNLQPSQTIPLSGEYITWCIKHNRIPSGDHLNIANIIDLDRYLTSYRTIIWKNSLQNNNFSIQLS